MSLCDTAVEAAFAAEIVTSFEQAPGTRYHHGISPDFCHDTPHGGRMGGARGQIEVAEFSPPTFHPSFWTLRSGSSRTDDIHFLITSRKVLQLIAHLPGPALDPGSALEPHQAFPKFLARVTLLETT
jgi:hypothetical protein